MSDLFSLSSAAAEERVGERRGLLDGVWACADRGASVRRATARKPAAPKCSWWVRTARNRREPSNFRSSPGTLREVWPPSSVRYAASKFALGPLADGW